MRWIRSHLRSAAWCALFALAVQLTLSFGHIHRSDLGAATSLSASAAEQVPQAADPDGNPSKPALPAAHYCVLCAIINLAGSVVPGEAPLIALPGVYSAPIAWSLAEASLTAPANPDARARAPPEI